MAIVTMAIVRDAKDIYDLECHICDESLKNPKVLPCLHSFCQSCLEESINDEKIIQCPLCHSTISLPTKGIEAFPVSSFANNMLNILAVQNPTSCTNCEDRDPATSRCLDCVENLCESCVTAHERIRMTKWHRIVSFEELQNNTVHDTIRCPSFCKIHDREVLKYFCETCDNAICRDCAIYEHREHNYNDLKDAMKTHSLQLDKILHITKQKTPILESSINDLTTIFDELKKRRDIVQQKINEGVDFHIRRLEEKRNKLLLKVDQMVETKEKTLQEQYEHLEFDLKNVTSSCDFVDNVMLYGNEAEFMDIKKFMIMRLQGLNEHQSQLVPEENEVLRFQANEKMLLVSLSNKKGYQTAPTDLNNIVGARVSRHVSTDEFGVLTTSKVFPPLCTVSEKNCGIAKIGQESKFDIIVRDRYGQQVDQGGEKITANLIDSQGEPVHSLEIIDHSNGEYTIHYTVSSRSPHQLSVYIHNIHIQGSPFPINISTGIDVLRIGPVLTKFGPSGVAGSAMNNAKTVTSENSYEPWGLTCDCNDRLIVTDHNSHKIQIFDQNGILLFSFGSRGKHEGEIWYPTGVTVDRENNIYVADHGNHRIQVFDDEGNYIRTIGSRGNMNGLLKGPCGITMDHEDRLIVADRDNNRVQVFNVNGEFLFCIGCYGSNEGKFDSPRHVHVTSENHILVSDSNNYRIQRFDSDGNYMSLLGEKGTNDGQFQCPSGICCDGDNNLLVADYKNLNVQIFDADGLLVNTITDSTSGLIQKPTGICVSQSGNLFVADRGSHKIILF